MANELVLRNKIEEPVNFTCANATGIEKGALLKLTDPRTAIITSGNDEVLAGVCAREKIASDGRTTVPVYLRGIFEAVASGAIIAGHPLTSAGGAAADVNKVQLAAVTASGAAILGYALETAADGESINIMVNVGAGGAQIS